MWPAWSMWPVWPVWLMWPVWSMWPTWLMWPVWPEWSVWPVWSHWAHWAHTEPTLTNHPLLSFNMETHREVHPSCPHMTWKPLSAPSTSGLTSQLGLRQLTHRLIPLWPCTPHIPQPQHISCSSFILLARARVYWAPYIRASCPLQGLQNIQCDNSGNASLFLWKQHPWSVSVNLPVHIFPKRKGRTVDLEEREGGEFGGVEAGKSVVGMYCIWE